MITMKKCDILIIGAGVSGSTSSLMLSKMGYKVITIDKEKNICDFTDEKIDITESELPDKSTIDPILKELKIKPFKKFNISTWRSRNEKFILDSDVYDYYFKRGKSNESLDYQLIKNAINNGCEIFNDSKVDKFIFKNDSINQVVIKSKNNVISINPRIVIGADGSFSECRRLSKINEIKSYYLEGIGIRFKNNDYDKTEVMFDREFAPGGYIYSGAKGDEGIIGLMIDKQLNNKTLEEILKLNIDQNNFFNKFKNFEEFNYFKGIEKYGILERVTKGNLLLVGGAGFFINPLMGYGVNYALRTGYNASRIINKNLEGAGNLEEYDKMYKNNFLPYFANSIKARKLFINLNNKDLDFIIRSLGNIINKDAKGLRSIYEIFKSRPSSFKSLKMLYSFSKILY